MTAARRYILDEVKTIEKECLERGISSGEWIEKYAEKYHRRHWDSTRERVGLVKKNHRSNSRWAAWLERVNDT